MSKLVENATKTESDDESLLQAIYSSKASEEMDDLQLAQILAQCRKHNEQHGVTGVLLYKNGYFLQAIEGATIVVKRLLSHIAEDSRHSNVEILHEKPIAQRDFPDWAMAFSNIDRLDMSKFGGFSAFDGLQFDAASFEQANVRPHEMLRAFKKELWD